MLKRSILASTVLHAGILIAAVIAWPHETPSADEPLAVVPVDLVSVAEVTNIAPTIEEPTPPAPPPQEKSEPQPEAAPPPPPAAEPAPAAPDQRLPPPREAQDNASPAPEHPVVPRQKPKPDAPPKFDVDSVLAMLDKRAPKAPPANAKVADTAQIGIGAQNALTMDLKDALLSQMRDCWNVPNGAPNPEQLIVQVRVFLSTDGSLARPPQLEPGTRAAAVSNPYMRTAAEAALRAVNVCEPYKHLPPERYDTWREIVMTFDPSKMIGR